MHKIMSISSFIHVFILKGHLHINLTSEWKLMVTSHRASSYSSWKQQKVNRVVFALNANLKHAGKNTAFTSGQIMGIIMFTGIKKLKIHRYHHNTVWIQRVGWKKFQVCKRSWVRSFVTKKGKSLKSTWKLILQWHILISIKVLHKLEMRLILY